MRITKTLSILSLASFVLMAAPAVPNSVPQWRKYSVVAIANGVNGCTSSSGCWQVNGVLGLAKTASTSQGIPLFTLPARGFVSNLMVKSTNACTGVTSLLSSLGTNTDEHFFDGPNYDLKAAVSNSNVRGMIPGSGSRFGNDTAGINNVVFSVFSSPENVDQVASGCAADVWVLWAVMP